MEAAVAPKDVPDGRLVIPVEVDRSPSTDTGSGPIERRP
jgi:hypothetical protein